MNLRTDIVNGEAGHARLHIDERTAINIIGRWGVSPREFGGYGDGVHTDTLAVQAAINACAVTIGLGGGKLDLSDGEWLIDDTLLIYRQMLWIIGTGWGNGKSYTNNASKGTCIKWAVGAGQKPMLQIRDSLGVKIQGVRFQGANSDHVSDTPTAAIDFHNVAGDAIGSNSTLVVDSCYIGSYPWGADAKKDHAVTTGILFGGDNANNDQWIIRDSIIKGCKSVGVDVPNSQSVWGHIQDTVIDSCPVGIHANADFQATNIQFNACDLDWQIDGTTSAWVYGYFAEGSKQFARLGAWVKFTVYGGDINVDGLTAANMIDCPDCRGARIKLSNIDFDRSFTYAPKIAMTSFSATQNLEGTLVIEDCSGLDFAAHLAVNPTIATHKRYVRLYDRATVIVAALANGDTLASKL